MNVDRILIFSLLFCFGSVAHSASMMAIFEKCASSLGRVLTLSPATALSTNHQRWEEMLKWEKIREKKIHYFKNGTNRPHLVILRNGVKAVEKTNDQYNEKKIEVLAYRINKILGFHLIPPTVIRPEGGELLQLFIKPSSKWPEIQKRMGSIYGYPGHPFSDDKILLPNRADSIEEASSVFHALGWPNVRASLEKQAIMDYLIANNDRHSENFFFNRREHLVSIDHESFGLHFFLPFDDFDHASTIFHHSRHFMQSQEGQRIMESLRLNRGKILSMAQNVLSDDQYRGFTRRIDNVLRYQLPPER